MTLSLDLTARRVVMASMIYYSLDEAVLSDGAFDAYCKRCATEWKALHPDRQFALGSAAKIATSGFHVRVSSLCEAGALGWLEAEGLLRGRRVVRTERQTVSKQVGRWTPCTGYRWDDT
ncbi:MAG: DNA ligase LigA-related protein [Pararhizobium sp.]